MTQQSLLPLKITEIFSSLRCERVAHEGFHNNDWKFINVVDALRPVLLWLGQRAATTGTEGSPVLLWLGQRAATTGTEGSHYGGILVQNLKMNSMGA